MPEKSAIWDAFYENRSRYKTDQNHFNAWCYACLDVVVAAEKQSEILASAHGSVVPPVKTEKEWCEIASKKVVPICGKVQGMRTHLMKKCTVIKASPARQRIRDEILGRVDAAKNSAPPPRAQSHPASQPSSSRAYSEMPPPAFPSASPAAPPVSWSWNAVQNPEFKLFFGKYMPQATLPDRRVLSGPILEREAAKVISRTRQQTNGKLATYSEDGWSNVARTHVDTSIISVEGTSYLLRTHDMTGRPKTGDELYDIVTSDLDIWKRGFL
ncbi:hypothetical protein B0H13DRAFT_2315412 [Mycena leptocephala]|nr:hypothetical protein B0H13DRAFT_2315412 [Mycena leptocephala]